MRAAAFSNLEISKDPSRNRVRVLPSCGAVPQPNAPLTPTLMAYGLKIENALS